MDKYYYALCAIAFMIIFRMLHCALTLYFVLSSVCLIAHSHNHMGTVKCLFYLSFFLLQICYTEKHAVRKAEQFDCSVNNGLLWFSRFFRLTFWLDVQRTAGKLKQLVFSVLS